MTFSDQGLTDPRDILLAEALTVRAAEGIGARLLGPRNSREVEITDSLTGATAALATDPENIFAAVVATAIRTASIVDDYRELDLTTDAIDSHLMDALPTATLSSLAVPMIAAHAVCSTLMGDVPSNSRWMDHVTVDQADRWTTVLCSRVASGDLSHADRLVPPHETLASRVLQFMGSGNRALGATAGVVAAQIPGLKESASYRRITSMSAYEPVRNWGGKAMTKPGQFCAIVEPEAVTLSELADDEAVRFAMNDHSYLANKSHNTKARPHYEPSGPFRHIDGNMSEFTLPAVPYRLIRYGAPSVAGRIAVALGQSAAYAPFLDAGLNRVNVEEMGPVLRTMAAARAVRVRDRKAILVHANNHGDARTLIALLGNVHVNPGDHLQHPNEDVRSAAAAAMFDRLQRA